MKQERANSIRLSPCHCRYRCHHYHCHCLYYQFRCDSSAGQAAADVDNPLLPSSSPQLAKAPASPFADESSQDGAPQRRRGRPAGVIKEPKAEAKSAAGGAVQINTDAEGKSGSKPKGRGRKPKQLGRRSKSEAAPSKEAAVEAEDEAGNEAYGEADEEAAAAARLDMARKASTGDGSRLERPHADSNDGTLDSAAASGMEVQQHDNADTGDHLQQQLPEEEEEFAGVVRGEGSVEGELLSNGVRVFNPVAPMTKPPHRLSRVTGGPCNCFCVHESRISRNTRPGFMGSSSYIADPT